MNINDKTSPNQMRVFMKRIREGNYVVDEDTKTNKDLTMHDMLKITRKLNEQADDSNNDNSGFNKKTNFDQEREEEKFRNFFSDMNVDIDFIELKVTNDLIFWGGTIDGVIQFVYKVTPDEKTKGVEFNYLPDFSADNPDNDMIVKKVESYYDSFYKYWRDNVLQK